MSEVLSQQSSEQPTGGSVPASPGMVVPPPEPPASTTSSTGDARLRIGFLLVLLLELAAMFTMTWMRYRFQGLEAAWLDLGKTANLYGFLLALPFILLALHGIFSDRRRRPSILGVSLALPAIGLLLLLGITISDPADQPIFGVLYLGLRAFGLGLLLITGSPHRRPLWRSVLSVLGTSALFALGAYLMVVVSIILNPYAPTPTNASPRGTYDAGVILGAAVWSGDKPSPVFRERIKRGYELLNEGVVEFLVLTGGNAPNELTEAEVGKRELLKLGVDNTRIALEEETSSTVEQVLFIRDELSKQKWESFVIISDQFHLKRALEICAFNDIEAVGIASESPLGPTTLAIYHLRESAALTLYWMFGL